MKTLQDLFEFVVASNPPHRELQRMRSGSGWRALTVRELEGETRATACRLAALGVGRGDRVALFSENRPEWHVVDFACHLLGAVLVPLYSTLPAAAVRYIVADSGSKVLLVSGRERARVALEALSGLSDIRAFGLDPGLAPGLLALAEIALPSETLPAVSIEPEDLASLIYTSGTTGEPKGVMLTHGNFISQVEAATPLFPITSSDVVMSFLPLSHVYERTVDYVFFRAGAQINYVESIERVPTQLPEIRPTIIASVPRLFERSYIKIISKVKQEGGAKRRLFEWALRVGRKVREAEWRGERPSAFLRGQLTVARARIFAKVLERLGGRLRFSISGGAPLAGEVAEFFDILGLPILQGYGLTESAPIIATNLAHRNRIGSVGPVLPGVEVRIASDGEILARGPNIMRGYWNQPDATAEAVDSGGWLHTGDIGYLDADGFLYITDRKKDIIVTSGGKNVAPQPLEARLSTTPFIAQAVLVGDKYPYLVALVVPNFENLEQHLTRQGVSVSDRAAMTEHPLAQAAIGDAIRSLNSELALHERIRRFSVLTRELSLEDGELTPTMKVRRRVVAERYHDRIERMYLKTQRAGEHELDD